MRWSCVWKSFCSGPLKIHLLKYFQLFNKLGCSFNLLFLFHLQQVYLKDRCPLLPMALLWSSNSYPQAKQWPTEYVGRMQHYLSLMTIKTMHVDLSKH